MTQQPRGAAPNRAASLQRPLIETILRLIWNERRISRADIARRLHISRSTVSEIVGHLLPTRLVTEIGAGLSSGGRRPIVLQFNDAHSCILGVEIGATHVAVALTDLRGHVLAWEQRDQAVRDDPDGTRALIVELCDACRAAGGEDAGNLLGVGVAVPSPVDPRYPFRLSEIVLPEWRGRSGLEALSVKYGVPVMVDNDANLGALAERWWGAGRGVDDFAYIKIATGIGSGHVIGGDLYRGATGVAGEIGHMAMDPHGPPCICGLRGCLATLVGSPALVARGRELLAEYPDSVLASRDVTITSIEDAALNGDALALRLTSEAAEYIGIAVASMLNMINPSAVIVGGGLARVGRLLLDPLVETARRRALVSSIAASSICLSELGPRAGALGAATLVLHEALNDSRLFATHYAKAKTR